MRLFLRYVLHTCLLLTFVVPLGSLVGCDKEETGILVAVTIAEADEGSLDGAVDELIFHVAITEDGGATWVLDRRATGFAAPVAGRSLAADPFRLLLKEDGDGVMETVRVAVVGYRDGAEVAWGTLVAPQFQEFLKGRIAQRTIELHDTSQTEMPFTIEETGCLIDLDGNIIASAPDDRDCDGAVVEDDCDDTDPTIGPGMLEVCDNGVDDNCNGTIDEVEDLDGDGYTNCDPVDCDDGNPDVHPGATEVCDGLDNDCDGLCDTGFDADGDGFTDCGDGTGSKLNADGACDGAPDAASWDCNDGSGDANPGGVEVCDGLDNDCNQQIDEGTGGPCYEGPSGTEGQGVCQGGWRHCVRGMLGPCAGQIVPSPEACNGQDDNCNGTVDENSTSLTCGMGQCRNTVASCSNGVVQTCSPGAPQTEICDGLDNDCNGLVDEVCGCIHVAPFGTTSNTGGANDPLASINAAIQRAVANPSGPQTVCVAASVGCSWTIYHEQVIMADGVQVLGQHDPSTWNRSATCPTEIKFGQHPAVYFGADVVQPTALDGFVVAVDNSDVDPESAAVVIEGSVGAMVGHCEVYGAPQGDATVGISIGSDPSTSVMAAPVIHNSLVEGGDGALLSVGIWSFDSVPSILSMCEHNQLDASGRCTVGCGGTRNVKGFRTGTPDTSVGIRLEESPGAVVDQVGACASANNNGVALEILGDASGTVVSRSSLGTWGPDVLAAGVVVEDCAGAAPWIGDNHQIWAETGGSGSAVSVGVASWGDCAPVIEANQLITGGIEDTGDICRGVICGPGNVSGLDSRCNIVGNVRIEGSTRGAPQSSIGVLCEPGSCRTIRGNQLITGRGGAYAVGVYLLGASTTLVDGNNIQGGCTEHIAVGLHAEDSSARVQNNLLHGGKCDGSTVSNSGSYIGVLLLNGGGANELDLHSNAVNGGGVPQSSCTSAGLYIDLVQNLSTPTGPLGIVRNNILEQGMCPSGYVVKEKNPAGDPRIFENNALVPGTNSSVSLYFDEDVTSLTSAAAVNALTDMTSSANIDSTPGISYAGGVIPVLNAGSALRNAGTHEGAPAWDWQRDSRPQESVPDIGPDEFVP